VQRTCERAFTSASLQNVDALVATPDPLTALWIESYPKDEK